MGSQKVVNNPLGSYPVDVDRDASGNTRQAVGIDFGTVSGGVYTASRVSATNPLPVTATFSGANVTVDNGAGAAAVNIQDGGNSITVDGTVTVSGTVSVNEPVSVDDNGGSLTVDGTVAVSSVGGTVAVSAASLPLPTGAATAALQLPDGHNVTVDNGSGAAAVNIQDGGNSITIDGTVSAAQSGTWNINNVSGTISLPTGAATLAEQQTQTASLSVIDDWDESDRAKVNLIVGQAGVQGGSGAVSATTQRVVLATDVALPTGSNTIGAVTNTVLSATGGSAQQVQGPSAVGASITTGNLFPCGFKDLFGNGVVPTGLDASGVVVMGVLPLDLSLNIQDFSAAGEVYSLVAATANSSATARYIAVTSAGEVLVIDRQNTASTSNVSGSATSVSLLASNTNRKKAKFYNDSSAILYLKEGTTASTTSFTTKLFPEGYYETTYTGAIDGIWASATGACRITELT